MEQRTAIDRVAAAQGLTAAAVIRDAVDRCFSDPHAVVRARATWSRG